MTLAIFDLDNTLLAGDSDHLWGEFLCERDLVDRDSFRARNEFFYQEYQRGELDIHAYLDFALEPLKGKSTASLAPLQADFLEQCISPILLPRANALLESHRGKGDRLLIITATNEFVARPIAELLGVSELLGCEVEVLEGIVTGRSPGIPSYREGKVTRLRDWMSTQGESLDGAFFYSDSHNDLPLLELVDNPVVVDGDETLLEVARRRGWSCISLRESAAIPA